MAPIPQQLENLNSPFVAATPDGVNPLQTQYLNHQDRLLLANNTTPGVPNGQMEIPSIWNGSNAGNTEANPAGTALVSREYAAVMSALQNPTGSQDQVQQVLSQFPAAQPGAATTDGEVPSVPMWAVLGAQSAISGADTAAYYQNLVTQQAAALAARDGQTAPPTGDPTQTTTGDPAQTGDPNLTGDPSLLNNPNDGTVTNPQVGDIAAASQAAFISQNRSQFNLGATDGNLDCGPACLAMAARLLGVVNQPVDGSNAESLISDVREKMTNNNNHMQITTLDQLETGAQRLGLRTQEVTGLAGIDAALANGCPVISYGNPSDPGAYGPTLTAAQYNQFDGKHNILVTGKVGNNYIIDDPLSNVGELTITPSQLQAYIDSPSIDLHGGVAVGRA
jgi:hypothetical protein